MCIMKHYLLSVCAFLLICNQVTCWRRDGYYTENNVGAQRDNDFSQSSEETPWYHNSEEDTYDESSYDSNQDAYRDRIIFSDDEVKLLKRNKQTTSTTLNPVHELLSCILKCNTVSDFGPVCGTDGITYYNLERLECTAKCGVDVRLRQLSACSKEETSSKSTPIVRNEQKKACMWSCPTTHEYNPVCGTDDVTYPNLGKLTCAQYCGVDVQLKRHSPCSKHTQNYPEPGTSTTTIRTTTRSDVLSRETISCIHSCPATSEYNPVCGSNDKTYFNSGKLDCASYCGVDVTLVRRSPCPSIGHNDWNPGTDEDHDFTKTLTTAKPVPKTSQETLDDTLNEPNYDYLDLRTKNFH